MHAIVKMRDRRNTSLSVSSNCSSNSSSNEKRSESPAPSSPLLPAPVTVTKENVPKPSLRSRFMMATKILAAVSAALLVWHFMLCGRMIRQPIEVPGSGLSSLAGSDTLPNKPTALIVADKQGHSRWTMSIPHNATFPLRGQQYDDMCTQSEALRNSIAQTSRLVRTKDWLHMGYYYSADPTFMDVESAEQAEALPTTKQVGDNVCESSLTFAFESQDGSFGRSLMLLWMSYGLAKKEGRAFFIDDSRWSYGKFTSYFAPPPAQSCERPPVHHILPCPHSAKHLVVSSSTQRFTFGSAFKHEFLRHRQHGAEKSHRIFDLIRSGYKDLFKLVGEDASYASSRIAQFQKDDAAVVGMHVRRGDRHPLEYEFSKDYLPLERYSVAARQLLQSHRVSLPAEVQPQDDASHMSLLLASDDPEIFSSAELSQGASPFVMQKSQERIQLATKATLDVTSPALPIQEPGSAYVKHVEENSGWEGGFYSALFFAAGRPKQKAGSTSVEYTKQSSKLTDHHDAPVPEQVMRMRELIGRAYVLDLAVLGASDGVVCATSSATCRLLGVMLGWDAVKDGKWVNVDDNRAWSWDGRRP